MADAARPGPPSAARPLTALEFGQYYYEHDCGIPYERSEEWLVYFDQLADHIVERLAPKQLLDAGCAFGLLVEKLRQRGVEAWGIDISEFAIGQVDESMRAYCAVGSLVDPLPEGFPERFDLATCIEVVEHMRPRDGEVAIARLAGVADRVLFSSSPVDYGEVTHVNVQAPEDWSAIFARAGLLRNVDLPADFPTAWTALYERANTDLGEVVRRYDRRLTRALHELRDLRETAMRLQERIVHLEATADGAAAVQRDQALARVRTLEAEVTGLRTILDSRGGRWLRALHAVRRAKPDTMSVNDLSVDVERRAESR